jgi:hypothetical protein
LPGGIEETHITLVRIACLRIEMGRKKGEIKFGDLVRFRRIILKLVLKGCSGKLWTGFVSLCFEVKMAVFWAWQ